MSNSISRRFFDHDVDLTNKAARKKWMMDLSLMLDDMIGAHNSIKTYESDPQVYSASGNLVLPHGFGKLPTVAQLWLKCTTAANGYAIGDLVLAGEMILASDSSSRGFGLQADLTNIYISFATVGTGCIVIVNKSSNASQVANYTNYDAVVKAIAI